MSDDTSVSRTEYDAYEHLQKSLYHARKAKRKFADGSKGESVSDNVVRWADKSVTIADRYLRSDTEHTEDDDE